MESKIALMKSILVGLLEEIDEIGEQIKTKGVVPKEICELCSVSDKRILTEFSSEEKKSQFIEWLKKMNVIAIAKREYDSQIFFKTSQELRNAKAEHIDGDGYVYSRYACAFYKRVRDFLSEFKMIETCPHIDKKPENILNVGFHSESHILDLPSRLFKEKIEYKLFLCCDDCKNLVENTMCNRVKKRGFLFDFDCPLKDIILRKRLSENELPYEDLEEEETMRAREHIVSSPIWRSPVYYLRQHSTVISLTKFRAGARILENRLRDVAKYLGPELIVAFDNHSNLPSYLELGTPILFYNQDGLFFYDKDRQPEEDMEKICEKIVNNLNAYVEKERGREHDRIVSALYSIGQELGYVPQKEYNKSGVRIDCVWLDREGKIQVASEVETTSTWKKDLISTWEVEPKLAIIVGLPKTDKVAKNLMESSLMKAIPHYVLYINKETNHAFLFDKQEIVKYYPLEKEEEDEEDTEISAVKRL